MNSLKTFIIIIIMGLIVSCSGKSVRDRQTNKNSATTDKMTEVSDNSQSQRETNTPVNQGSPDPGIKSGSSENEVMVWIEGGTFLMGGDNNQANEDEFPKHKVTVSGFWMDMKLQGESGRKIRKYQLLRIQPMQWKAIVKNRLKPDAMITFPSQQTENC